MDSKAKGLNNAVIGQASITTRNQPVTQGSPLYPANPSTKDNLPNTSSQSNPYSTLAPIGANDSNSIENEWIHIARKIIDDNKDDPFMLSRSMTLLRSDYLKKRYNKTIKTPEI